MSLTQPNHFGLCQTHFRLTSSCLSSVAAELNTSVSFFSQLGYPRRLYNNPRASCSEGEAVHGEHRSAGSGGQRAWEGKEMLSLIMFPSGPAFLEKSLLYRNIFGAQHALLFCQASGGGKKASSALLERSASHMLSLLWVFNGSISAGCACSEQRQRILCAILAVRKALKVACGNGHSWGRKGDYAEAKRGDLSLARDC